LRAVLVVLVSREGLYGFVARRAQAREQNPPGSFVAQIAQGSAAGAALNPAHESSSMANGRAAR